MASFFVLDTQPTYVKIISTKITYRPRKFLMLSWNPLLTEAQNIADFVALSSRLIPGINSLAIEDADWMKIIKHCERLEIVRLTASTLLPLLCELKEINHNDLVASLSNQQPARTVKLIADIPQKSFVKRKRGHDTDVDITNNQFILDKTPETDSLHKPLAKKGVRVSELSPATPQRGYTEVKQTPGGQRVYPVYSNTMARLFKPLTPYKQGGMVNTENASQEKIARDLPNRGISRSESIRFTATLPKLVIQQSLRRQGQRKLMKGTCRAVFAAHGIETMDKAHGSHYHWSHLIAHFLGGEHRKENIIPATAASNYNTLEIIEQFVECKLTNDRVSSIDINVIPTYSNNSFIPDQVQFNLRWQEGKIQHDEAIIINPRSHQRITASMRSVIAFLRDQAKQLDEDNRQRFEPK